MAQVGVDSILVVSFGGPERPEDVMPFLRNVTRGRNVPDERLAAVAEHYLAAGGRSPINDQNRELIAALEQELARLGPSLPIYWGNRNWHPFLEDTVNRMAADGRRHAVAFVTSAYSSYSSCRQYVEDIERARSSVGAGAPVIEKVRQFYNHPGFVEPMAANTAAALGRIPAQERGGAHIVFTAHSIPVAAARASRYEHQLLEASRLVMEQVAGAHPWTLVFQSKSASPGAWLEPDVVDHMEELAVKGVRTVVAVPIGFVSDHMEVVHDLDAEAAAAARSLGIHFERAATVGAHPRFVAAVRELICEHIDTSAVRLALGVDGPTGCLGDGCCPAAAQPLSGEPLPGTSNSTAPDPLDVR